MYSSSVRSRSRANSAASPSRRVASASSMLMSCPLAALVAGVKIGVGQAVRFPQPCRQGDAAHRPALAVLLPARPRQVPARDALDVDGPCLPRQHRPATQHVGVGLRRGGEAGHIEREEVVRDDIGQLVEPERRQLRQHLALVGDAGAQHVVEGGDAVGGDQEQRIAQVVDVAHFAGAKPRDAWRRSVWTTGGADGTSGSLAKRCMLADAARRWGIVRPDSACANTCERSIVLLVAGGLLALFLRNTDLRRGRRRDGPGPAGPGRGGAGRHRPDLRAAGAALAVPAGADRPRPPVGGAQGHDHRVCGDRAAAGAGRRIAAPVPARAQGRAERHGDVCDRDRRAAPRHHHRRVAVHVVPAGLRHGRGGGRRDHLRPGEAGRCRGGGRVPGRAGACCSSWPGIPARSIA